MFHHHLTYMYSWVSAFLPLHTVRASEALSGTDKFQQRWLAETRPRILLSDGSFMDVLAAWVCPGSAANERSVEPFYMERSHSRIFSPPRQKLAL